MTAIFHIVLPMFAIVALGFYAARYRGFTNTMSQGLSRFLGIYALPALLFGSMAKADIPAFDISLVLFNAAFFGAAYVVFGMGAAWMWAARRRQELATVSFAVSFSSIGLIGLPIILEAYGHDVALLVALLILLQSPLLFTTATLVAELHRADNGRPLEAAVGAIKATLLSPLILSIVVGLAVNMLDVAVPAAAMKAADLLALTVLPCACFTLGTSLSFATAMPAGSAPRMSTSGLFARAAVMAVLKTVVHPLLTWLLAVEVFHLPTEWTAAAVTAAALPIGINVYAFAERYQSGRELVSMSLLLSTLLAPASISIAFMVSAG